jgi:hypothetical protein
MVGFITERDLAQADEAFPGIMRFFASLPRKPHTFLELVTLFVHRGEPAAEARGGSWRRPARSSAAYH